MKALKYLFAFWAGILIYASCAVAFGSMGFFAYRQMEREREKQEASIENLKRINRELENARNSLLYDEDALAVYAREQGFASGRERFIRIVGLGLGRKPRISPGELVAVAEPQHAPDRTLRIIAFCAAASILICMVYFDFMKILRDER